MEILEFLKEWSPVIIPGLVIVLDVLILVLKNRPRTIDDFQDCLNQVLTVLPNFINDREVAGHGDEKKQQVILLALKLLKKRLGRSLSDSESIYSTKTISEQIENILSTPQKKGD